MLACQLGFEGLNMAFCKNEKHCKSYFYNISSQHELKLCWPQDAEAAGRLGEAVSSTGFFWA